jgi:hypothetical protein
MATTGITIQLNAVDRTSAVVETARGRFVAMQESIRTAQATFSPKDGKKQLGFWQTLSGRLIGVRFAAQSAAAILSRVSAPFRRVLSDMHELTDRADEVGASASDILRLSGAFGKLGIKNAGVEDITHLFNLMRKSTGDSGVDGFKRQMSAIAGIADETERAKELTRVFGRDGIRLWNLAAHGPEAFKRTVENAMAAVTAMSEESIQTASQVHKGFVWIADDIKGKWDEAVASIVRKFTGDLGGTIEMQMALWWANFKASCERFNATVGSLVLFVYDAIKELVTYSIKAQWNLIKTLAGTAAEFGKQFWNLVTGGDFDVGPVVERLKRGLAEAPKFKLDMDGSEYQGMIDAIDERQREEEERIRAHFAEKLDSGPIKDFEDIQAAGVAAASRISDAWKGAGAVLAGSYEAVKLQALRSFGVVGGAVGGAVKSARDAIRGGSSATASASSPAASQDSRNLASILTRLADLLTVQRDGWNNLESALGAMETV